MLTLLATLTLAACDPSWEPDSATRGEEGYPLLVWHAPTTCETLVVTGAHKERGGLQSTLLWFDPKGRVRQRYAVPKTMWPSSAAVDAPRQRVLLLAALMGAQEIELRLEARRLNDFALIRGFGSAGTVTLRIPREAAHRSSTGGEAQLLVDPQGRPVLVVVTQSVEGPSALHALRLDVEGGRDASWRAPSPISVHERTNSNELTATWTAKGELVIGAGTKLRAQFFRLRPNGELDERFGKDGRVAPETMAALAIAATPDGAVHFTTRDRGQLLSALDARGTPGAPLKWKAFDDRNEFPEVVLPVSGDRLLVVARSYDFKDRRSALVLTLWRRDGRLDARFGEEGLLVLDDRKVDYRSPRATLDAEGRALVAVQRGQPQGMSDGPLALLRFELPPALAQPSRGAEPDARPPPARSPWATRPAAPPAPEDPPGRARPTPAETPPLEAPRRPQPAEAPRQETPPAPQAAEEEGVYVFTDERGVETWVDSLDKVPARHRAKARKLSP